ncbi:hypothetical protein [Streptomyces sp. ME19-01-6]|uniref:hypothetical protein n=1 Tax=Streptomyces sp. ME19-01-6 TaxID=3028686 RepID=UPI0029B7DF37|nr:hypothetical protein [Streptomyces sp. ME19-01-6]MDX3230593.1 hypothetical protein [Streptomyces sp. ME19-01-6]
MFRNRSPRRRHQQIMAAARHMVDAHALIVDDNARISPEHVIVLAYGRHQIGVTTEEATNALGAALVERGFGLDRIATSTD